MLEKHQIGQNEAGQYFRRIGISRPLATNVETLDSILAAQVMTIPFENLDVQMGNVPPFDLERIYSKIVVSQRGGWCYELNGLLAGILTHMGFSVRLTGGDVRPAGKVPQRKHDHMALIVETEGGSRLADAGFGGSLVRSLPLREGRYEDELFSYELKKIGERQWSYDESNTGGLKFGYNFDEKPADVSLLRQIAFEQAEENWSPFVRNLVVQRRFQSRHEVLRGRVLTTTDNMGITKQVLSGRQEFDNSLAEMGLQFVETDRVWDKVCARHNELFG